MRHLQKPRRTASRTINPLACCQSHKINAIYLRAFPHITAVFCILLNDRQDTGRDNAVRFAKVAIDLLQSQGDRLLELFQFLRQCQVPWCSLPRHDYDYNLFYCCSPTPHQFCDACLQRTRFGSVNLSLDPSQIRLDWTRPTTSYWPLELSIYSSSSCRPPAVPSSCASSPVDIRRKQLWWSCE